MVGAELGLNVKCQEVDDAVDDGHVVRAGSRDVERGALLAPPPRVAVDAAAAVEGDHLDELLVALLRREADEGEARSTLYSPVEAPRPNA